MSYAIAAGHELTAHTAEEILKTGGNAFDAAVGAFLTSWVTEPCMSGPGGGGFAVIQTADGKASVYDFFCQTPIVKRQLEEIDFYPIIVDFTGQQEIFHVGHGSAAVPGSVAGAFRLHQELGTLPFKVLAEQAIHYARHGVKLNAFQHLDLVLLKDILITGKRGRELFLDNSGRLKDIGEVVTMPYLADTLDYIAREGPDAFYKGEIATRIVDQCIENGGFITRKDLAHYTVLESRPLTMPFLDYQILTNPFPSMGGGLMALLLHQMASLPRSRFLSTGHIKSVAEALAYCDRLGKTLPEISAAMRALKGEIQIPSKDSPLKTGGTSHFNIADSAGNAIALSMSIGEGSGFFVKGTDIHMNNMLGEGALLPEGFHTWRTNVRMASMMAPTIVLSREGAFRSALGSGGAGRIPYVIGQVIYNRFAFDIPLHPAVNGPRIHAEQGELNIEPGFDIDDTFKFEGYRINQWHKQSLYFGGVHTIDFDGKHFHAAGDDRRDGVAVVRNDA